MIAQVGLQPFRPRLPWLGGDLQTLRDSLRPVPLPPDRGQALLFDLSDGDQLLGRFDGSDNAPALVLVLHGLAGGSDSIAPRRLALTLQQAGLAVLRLNLRGAGPGRPYARGTYAACSNRDLLQVLPQLRELAAGRLLLGVGVSVGGTNLLNAVLASAAAGSSLFDGLVCLSSPLDLVACAHQIARRRNRIYERWLVRRLVSVTRADPAGLGPAEQSALDAVHSIRAFDAAITAPRWGYGSVEEYYRAASPLPRLLHDACSSTLPPTLLLHALDDPWVPAAAAQRLARIAAVLPKGCLEVVLTASGGHNGFHGVGDGPFGSWGDALVQHWAIAQCHRTTSVAGRGPAAASIQPGG